MIELNRFARDGFANFLSPCGFGDTMMLCAFAKAWELKNKRKIHFLVKPSHAVVMNMFGWKNFTTVLFSAKDLDFYIKGSNKEITIAHPLFCKGEEGRELVRRLDNKEISFIEMYANFLGLSSDAFDLCIKYPKPTESFLKRFPEIGNSVLLCPEANSVPLLADSFWERLADKLTKKGYVVYTNTVNKSMIIRGTISLDLEMEDLLRFSFLCNHVYSIRSGLCDLLHPLEDRLTVFYPNEQIMSNFSLRGMFNKNVEEIIVNELRVVKKRKRTVFSKIWKSIKTSLSCND